MTGIILILLGVAAGSAGYARFRGPWSRYQALKEQDANIARYESWRGGVRDTGTTGASIAMELLRKQYREAGVIVAAGVTLIVLGILLL
jgi:hypothetical protein